MIESEYLSKIMKPADKVGMLDRYMNVKLWPAIKDEAKKKGFFVGADYYGDEKIILNDNYGLYLVWSYILSFRTSLFPPSIVIINESNHKEKFEIDISTMLDWLNNLLDDQDFLDSNNYIKRNSCQEPVHSIRFYLTEKDYVISKLQITLNN